MSECCKTGLKEQERTRDNLLTAAHSGASDTAIVERARVYRTAVRAVHEHHFQVHHLPEPAPHA